VTLIKSACIFSLSLSLFHTSPSEKKEVDEGEKERIERSACVTLRITLVNAEIADDVFLFRKPTTHKYEAKSIYFICELFNTVDLQMLSLSQSKGVP
jgi:hypothetical protein